MIENKITLASKEVQKNLIKIITNEGQEITFIEGANLVLEIFGQSLTLSDFLPDYPMTWDEFNTSLDEPQKPEWLEDEIGIRHDYKLAKISLDEAYTQWQGLCQKASVSEQEFVQAFALKNKLIAELNQIRQWFSEAPYEYTHIECEDQSLDQSCRNAIKALSDELVKDKNILDIKRVATATLEVTFENSVVYLEAPIKFECERDDEYDVISLIQIGQRKVIADENHTLPKIVKTTRLEIDSQSVDQISMSQSLLAYTLDASEDYSDAMYDNLTHEAKEALRQTDSGLMGYIKPVKVVEKHLQEDGVELKLSVGSVTIERLVQKPATISVDGRFVTFDDVKNYGLLALGSKRMVAELENDSGRIKIKIDDIETILQYEKTVLIYAEYLSDQLEVSFSEACALEVGSTLGEAYEFDTTKPEVQEAYFISQLDPQVREKIRQRGHENLQPQGAYETMDIIVTGVVLDDVEKQALLETNEGIRCVEIHGSKPLDIDGQTLSYWDLMGPKRFDFEAKGYNCVFNKQGCVLYFGDMLKGEFKKPNSLPASYTSPYDGKRLHYENVAKLKVGDKLTQVRTFTAMQGHTLKGTVNGPFGKLFPEVKPYGREWNSYSDIEAIRKGVPAKYYGKFIELICGNNDEHGLYLHDILPDHEAVVAKSSSGYSSDIEKIGIAKVKRVKDDIERRTSIAKDPNYLKPEDLPEGFKMGESITVSYRMIRTILCPQVVTDEDGTRCNKMIHVVESLSQGALYCFPGKEITGDRVGVTRAIQWCSRKVDYKEARDWCMTDPLYFFTCHTEGKKSSWQHRLYEYLAQFK